MTADDTVHNQIVTVADGLAVLVLPCGGNLFLNLLAQIAQVRVSTPGAPQVAAWVTMPSS